MAIVDNFRMFQMIDAKNIQNESEVYLNANVTAYESSFVSETGNEATRAMTFIPGSMLMPKNSKNLNLGTGYFLIAFWLQYDNGMDGNTVLLKFDDDSYTELYLNQGLDWSVPHYITIVRDTDGTITGRCDGTEFGTANNQASFNLGDTGDSFIYIGNVNIFMNEEEQSSSITNNNIIVDDIVFANSDYEQISIIPPTNYVLSYTYNPDDYNPIPKKIQNILKVY